MSTTPVDSVSPISSLGNDSTVSLSDFKAAVLSLDKQSTISGLDDLSSVSGSDDASSVSIFDDFSTLSNLDLFLVSEFDDDPITSAIDDESYSADEESNGASSKSVPTISTSSGVSITSISDDISTLTTSDCASIVSLEDDASIDSSVNDDSDISTLDEEANLKTPLDEYKDRLEIKLRAAKERVQVDEAYIVACEIYDNEDKAQQDLLLEEIGSLKLSLADAIIDTTDGQQTLPICEMNDIISSIKGKRLQAMELGKTIECRKCLLDGRGDRFSYQKKLVFALETAVVRVNQLKQNR